MPNFIPHFGAFESTKLPGKSLDILGTTRHIQYWREDLEMLRKAGVRDLRYSIPWHRIEPRPGEFDFSWIDQPLNYMRDHDMDPVLDPLHHISFPDWLEQGFADPLFPTLYARFLGELGRYEWAGRYTLINEPLPTTVFCSLSGLWPPYGDSDQEFVRMVVRMAEAMCLGGEKVLKSRPGTAFFHVDTAEFHHALDRRSEPLVEFFNQRRFLFHDLTTGRVDKNHPLVPYLRANGMTPEEQDFFLDHPVPFHVLGMDYYVHCEMDWRWDSKRNAVVMAHGPAKPRGFASVAQDYVKRYETPVMLSETNLRGTVADRLTWLRYMEEEVEMLQQAGADVRGFCWYPSIDSTDWCHLCTQCTGNVDPQGIWWLNRDRHKRNASELSACYAALAQGKMTWRELPAYRFSEPERLRGHLARMQRWSNWKDQDVAESNVQTA